MIINTEVRNATSNTTGRPVKEVIISYIDKNCNIAYKTFEIPTQYWYKWDYAKKNEVPDKKFRSWDDKPITRIPLKESDRFPETRITEIICQLCEKVPGFSEINELHMPEIAFCDIEVMVGEDGFPAAEEAKNQVNTISWVYKDECSVLGLCKLDQNNIKRIQERMDEHCKRFKTRYKFKYYYFEDEYSMLAYFMENFVKEAIAISGWNFLRYDWQYLYNRCKNIGLNITGIAPYRSWTSYPLLKLYNKNSDTQKVKLPMHKILFDYLEVYQKWDTAIKPHESLKLDDVGEIAVGVNKVKHTMGFNEMYEKAPEDYVFYNGVDSILVREIHNELKTANTFFSLANLIHCDLMKAFSPVQSLQIFQTEYIYKENKVFCTKDKKEDEEEVEKEKYEGAYVYDPNPGQYRNVVALDFASLYPTTMRQFNISPDTFITKDKNYIPGPDEMKTTSGAVYKRNVQGILPKILTDVYNQRKAYKKEMKIALSEMHELEHILEKRLNGV